MMKSPPRISIATLSLNQCSHIEKAARLVIEQDSSKGSTVEAIKKHGDLIDSWVSEPDDGQSVTVSRRCSASSFRPRPITCSSAVASSEQ